MYTVQYLYASGFHGQQARGEKTFATESEALNYARRLESTPGYAEVTVWQGSRRVA
jgi:hypothetical protein